MCSCEYELGLPVFGRLALYATNRQLTLSSEVEGIVCKTFIGPHGLDRHWEHCNVIIL